MTGVDYTSPCGFFHDPSSNLPLDCYAKGGYFKRPIERISRTILMNLEENLNKQIIGQNDAIKIVVNAIKRSSAGLRDKDKTIINLLFVGPTGVGKTALVQMLGELLGNIPVLRFDMSEFTERYSISTLKGSAPGYTCHEDGGLLTNAVCKQPYSIVLIDEIEKAHPDVYALFLQIMDRGATLMDSKGNKVDFHNVIFIMTSNAGASEIGEPLLGFGERSKDESVVSKALDKTFSTEFLNRLDAIIPFKHISQETIALIVRKELEAFAKELEGRRSPINLHITKNCEDQLAKECYSYKYGAREVSRNIESKIKNLFTDEILFGRLKDGGTVDLDWRDGYCIDIHKEESPELEKGLYEMRQNDKPY